MMHITTLLLIGLLACLHATYAYEQLVFQAQSVDTCSDQAFVRNDCGFTGITQRECEVRNCCWNPTKKHNVTTTEPWCFYKDQEPNKSYTCSVDVAARGDCGWLGITEKACKSRNCCWSPSDVEGGVYCFHQRRRCSGYEVTNFAFEDNEIYLSATLLENPGCSHYGPDIRNLKITVSIDTAAQLHIKIQDADHDRYEIPEKFVPAVDQFEKWQASSRLADAAFKFSYRSRPFAFAVTRKDNNETIFNTDAPGMDALVFEQQYLELSSRLSSHARIYGLGEVVHATFERDKRNTWQTLWARDAATPVDENVYGSHPFYLGLADGQAHGVFLRNSNGMDIVMSGNKITYKVIGGILDFYFFAGPTPDDVIDQYTALIGRPALPPKWSLGFHHSRYGFEKIEDVAEVTRRYRENDIPLETIWMDIDYMDERKDFTYDPEKFPVNKVNELLKDLHERHQKMVAIIDPGIKVERGYEPFETGVLHDVFLKNKNGHYAVGKVWPGYTVFPDFHSNETLEWWKKSISDWLDLVPLDGIWIDMNEVASWCQGECPKSEIKEILKLLPPSSPNKPGPAAGTYSNLKDPYYEIRNFGNSRESLELNTAPVDAIHSDGILEYDVHNLYGLTEAIATRKALLDIRPNERPFILSRSTFSGSGAHAAHWLGDNWSTWESFQHSVSGTLSFQLFGIPFTGPDICGFNGDTNEQLCLRWMQLGAFYPFARNHNAINQIDQEPFLWKSVANASREALNIRYKLLPYLYTQFEAASRTGKPIWRPLFFDYPTDKTAARIDRQILFGSAVLLSPVLDPDTTSVHAYLPAGRWFDWYTHEKVADSEHGVFKKLDAPMNKIPVHVRGGHIIPLQEPRMTIHETASTPISLLVALDNNGQARGNLYIDDGISLNVEDTHTTVKMTAGATNLHISGTFGYSHQLNEITILGCTTCNDLPSEVMANKNLIDVATATLDAATGSMTLSGLNINLSQDTVIEWRC